jgi:hypothetical protein
MRASLKRSATAIASLQWREGPFSALDVVDSRVDCITADREWQQVSLEHTYFQSMLQRAELATGDDVGQFCHDLEHMISSDEFEDDFANHWPDRSLASRFNLAAVHGRIARQPPPSEMQALFRARCNPRRPGRALAASRAGRRRTGKRLLHPAALS